MLGVLLAAQLAIVAHAADTVGACEPLDLSVAVSAPGAALPTLRTPSFAPFDLMSASTLPRVAADSRAVPATLVEYRYLLVADRPGRYTIPAFEAALGGQTVRSRPITVVVTPNAGDGEPAIVTRARIDTGRPLTLPLAVPETVYVGQQADYTVAVFLNTAMRDRLRHNPTFYPPDMQAVLAYDVAAGNTEERSLSGSRCFDALVYRRALFPLQAGRIVIPPAQLTYSLPASASFFSREESHEIQTDSAVIVAVDPPAAGRPPDFDGAVGDFRLAARLQSAAVRVGDPLTLTVRVTGTGNVKLLPRPHLAVPWATVVPADARVQVDTSGRRISGSKEFDWILTPRLAGAMGLPVVRYAYFDPQARRYRVASSAPASVRVQPGTLATLDTGQTPRVLPLRPTYRGALAPPLSSTPAFWFLLALAPLPAL
ncbi:MAG: BatD family protein, partial [Gemmatimonadota bacterium]|nr:BatD family protein [Gemmatimonadota bacterium]